MIAAFGLMLAAILYGSPLTIFFNIPALLIVLGGTTGVAFIHYPFKDLIEAFKVAQKAVFHRETSIKEHITQLMGQNLNDPSKIGPAMAVALLTTFYGAVIANVVCLPIAGKLRNRSESEILIKTLIIEGMQSILSGENPRIIEQKLHAYISPKLRASAFDR